MSLENARAPIRIAWSGRAARLLRSENIEQRLRIRDISSSAFSAVSS
jgi:hypothetical protein